MKSGLHRRKEAMKKTLIAILLSTMLLSLNVYGSTVPPIRPSEASDASVANTVNRMFFQFRRRYYRRRVYRRRYFIRRPYVRRRYVMRYPYGRRYRRYR
jgi:hypothetical protein